MNQSLESTLRCVTARHPATWSSYLTWVEYNSLVSAVTGISPFLGSLFDYQEEEADLPSVRVNLNCWWSARRRSLVVGRNVKTQLCRLCVLV